MCMSGCDLVHLSAAAPGGPEEGTESFRAHLSAAVSRPMWVLETELRSSANSLTTEQSI